MTWRETSARPYATELDVDALCDAGGNVVRGVIENKHSTDVESLPPPLRVCMKYCIDPQGKSCSDLGVECLF